MCAWCTKYITLNPVKIINVYDIYIEFIHTYIIYLVQWAYYSNIVKYMGAIQTLSKTIIGSHLNTISHSMVGIQYIYYIHLTRTFTRLSFTPYIITLATFIYPFSNIINILAYLLDMDWKRYILCHNHLTM